MADDTPGSVPGDAVGRRERQVDGRQFVTGAAQYVADVDRPNQAHLALVRSAHGHALIEDIDPTAALAMDGVHCVVTGDDIAAETNPLGIHDECYALPPDRVRYAGEPVAAVAAETAQLAADAAERVEVTVDRLDAVVDPREALAEDAPLVHPDRQDDPDIAGNVSGTFTQDVGDVEAGFAAADRVLERSYTFPPVNGAPMEPHGCVADWDAADGSLTVHTTTQIMHRHKTRLATVFDLPANAVHVIQEEVGGAFGNKLNLLPHEVCAVLCSKRIGRPVKAVLDRREHLETSKAGFGYVMDVRVGVDADGAITAWEETVLQDEGAYHESGLYIVGGAAANTRLLGYDVPNIRLEGKAVYTNHTPGAPVRGTGARQLAYAREAIVSELADELGRDPVDYRRRLTVSNADCPWEAPTGNVLTSSGLHEAIDRAVELSGYEATRERVADEPHRGVGVAVGHHVSSCRGRQRDADSGTVDCRLEEDGSVTLRTTACDMGTSPRTTLAQVCADVLGVEPADVRVVDGDTHKTPPADGSHSSRTMAIMGSAAHDAATEVRETLTAMAAAELEASPADLVVGEGTVRVRGTDRAVTFAALAETIHNDQSRLPDGIGPGDLSVTSTFDTRDDRVAARTEPADEHGLGNISMDYPCSAQVVVVAVEPTTGAVTVESHVAVDDAGRAVNPLVVEGQIEGGAVQGIGAALSEHLAFDPETGQSLNASFADYGIPRITDVPRITADYVEVPSASTPGGWKGVAEGPYIVAPAAVANAVCDAIDVRLTDLPLTPQRVKAAIEGRTPP